MLSFSSRIGDGHDITFVIHIINVSRSLSMCDWFFLKNSDPIKSMEKNWQKEFQNALALQRSVIHGTDILILKSNQLDAEQLDNEITNRLKVYFMCIFKFFDPTYISEYQPEITALLSGLIYKFSVYDNNQSYGDALQNLRYRNEFASSEGKHIPPSPMIKILHAFATIGFPYLWDRMNRKSIDDEWGSMEEISWQKKSWRFLNRFERILKMISAINFMLFLLQGKYRNLVDRVLGMRLVYSSPYMNRSVSFDFMNRELVWNSFAEMLLFLLPLINFEKISRWFSGYGSQTLVDPENKHPFDCPICLHSISVPYVTPCGHNYDYWCVQNLLWQDSSFTCYKCGQHVSTMKRLGQE